MGGKQPAIKVVRREKTVCDKVLGNCLTFGLICRRIRRTSRRTHIGILLDHEPSLFRNPGKHDLWICTR